MRNKKCLAKFFHFLLKKWSLLSKHSTFLNFKTLILKLFAKEWRSQKVFHIILLPTWWTTSGRKILRFWGDPLQNLKLMVKFLKKSQNFHVNFFVSKMGWEHLAYAQIKGFYPFGALKQWFGQEIKEKKIPNFSFQKRAKN